MGAQSHLKTSQIELRVLETEPTYRSNKNAGWSSLVARQAHNLKAVGSNPTPATNLKPCHKAGFLVVSA
jgi:hypothetical protein